MLSTLVLSDGEGPHLRALGWTTSYSFKSMAMRGRKPSLLHTNKHTDWSRIAELPASLAMG
ncbi:hypothetical protein B2_gp53 [Shigella phage B2]|nr:hypothetical protein B2_gp53 [Shigella phage B2]